MSRARALAVSDWPEADRAMWAGLVAVGDLLDGAGRLAHLRRTTRDSLLHRYRRWLGWLAHAEPDALALERPADRATPARLGRWTEHLAHTAPMSRWAVVDGVLQVLMAAAPGADWSRQARLRAGLRRRAWRRHGDRKVGRVLSSAVLLEAGLRLAGPHADAATTPLEAAKRRREGAMIATLALLPMRLRAFAGLELGASLRVAADGMEVHLSGDMTKSGRPWSAPVPRPLHPVLRRYVEEVRPWLMARAEGGAAHDRLWVMERGRPYEAQYLGVRIGDATRRLLGVRVTPHLFRDAAATTLSRASPENARLIRPLLGHASFGTAERHYIHAGRIEAGRDHARLIETLRED